MLRVVAMTKNVSAASTPVSQTHLHPARAATTAPPFVRQDVVSGGLTWVVSGGLTW